MQVSGDISATIRIHLVIERHGKCLLIVIATYIYFFEDF